MLLKTKAINIYPTVYQTNINEEWSDTERKNLDFTHFLMNVSKPK